jgi:hypothetical protein
MFLRRAPEKYITGAALDKADIETRKEDVSKTGPVYVFR